MCVCYGPGDSHRLSLASIITLNRGTLYLLLLMHKWRFRGCMKFSYVHKNSSVEGSKPRWTCALPSSPGQHALVQQCTEWKEEQCDSGVVLYLLIFPATYQRDSIHATSSSWGVTQIPDFPFGGCRAKRHNEAKDWEKEEFIICSK